MKKISQSEANCSETQVKNCQLEFYQSTVKFITGE